MEENTEQRIDLTLFSEKIQGLKERIASVIVGQEQTVDLVLTAILANGHVLIEGVPGVAKTLLARLTARLIDADFSRIQFTPDLMPSDVLGTTVFNMKTNEFDFHKGPIFADIVLVDEINRAPAKTQSALFEVMEERQISIDGTTHRMGELYTILATQNPVEQEGTYKLPEAQLDRFLMKITMDYPSLDEEVNILERHHFNAALVKLDDITPALTKEELLTLRAFMKKRLQMVYFNDIDSVYPLFLCLLMAFSATVYETMQVFVPDTWEHFYFNPTLSPFKVPFILSVFLTGIWLFIIVTLAVLDDLFRQLTPAAAVFYLLGLMSCCIFCYFFFILTTHIYIGYFFLACFIWLFVKKVRRGSGYKYRCGNCGQKLREKGQCPHCGAVNE